MSPRRRTFLIQLDVTLTPTNLVLKKDHHTLNNNEKKVNPRTNNIRKCLQKKIIIIISEKKIIQLDNLKVSYEYEINYTMRQTNIQLRNG